MPACYAKALKNQKKLFTLQQISNESRNNDFTAVEALKVENKQLNRYLLGHLINLEGGSYLIS